MSTQKSSHMIVDSETNFNHSPNTSQIGPQSCSTNLDRTHSVSRTESDSLQYTSTIGPYSCSTNINRTRTGLEAGTGPKTVIIMRHGERVDDLFPDWVERGIKFGKYTQFDMNMPATLDPLSKIRKLVDFVEDTPLTQMGTVAAQMIGRGLKINGLVPDSVYCSPSLRCVQTATLVSRAAGINISLKIEPGIFENTDLYPKVRPKWVSPEIYHQIGFGIDTTYRSFYRPSDVWFSKEDVPTYNVRAHSTFDDIFRREALLNPNGTVLIVGHASSVDLVAGYFSIPRRRIRTDELRSIADRVPYCGTAVFHRRNESHIPCRGIWEYQGEAALAPITYKHFSSRVDHKFLVRKNAEEIG